MSDEQRTDVAEVTAKSSAIKMIAWINQLCMELKASGGHKYRGLVPLSDEDLSESIKTAGGQLVMMGIRLVVAEDLLRSGPVIRRNREEYEARVKRLAELLVKERGK